MVPNRRTENLLLVVAAIGKWKTCIRKNKISHRLKIHVFWCVTPCWLASTSRRLEGSQCLHVQGLATWQLSSSEHNGNAATRTVHSYTQNSHFLEESDLQRHISHPGHRVIWLGPLKVKIIARKGSRVTAEGTVGSGVSVQVLLVVGDMSSSFVIRNMTSILVGQICGVL